MDMMVPSFGMRIMLVLIVCAPAAGVSIAYAEGGTSLWTAPAFASSTRRDPWGNRIELLSV